MCYMPVIGVPLSAVRGFVTGVIVVGWKIINIENVYKFVFILFIPLLKR